LSGRKAAALVRRNGAPATKRRSVSLEYRDVPGKMREATAGDTESTASAAALGHHPAGEHRDEAIHQVRAIARRYQRVVKTKPRRLASAKWQAAQVSTRGRGVYDLFSLSPRNAVSVLASR
jgi:hypothetical protein